MVERSHKSTKSMLAKYVKDVDQKDWDLRLPFLMMAYNNSPHETTKQTPFRMVYGDEMTLPCEMGIEQIAELVVTGNLIHG